MLTFKQIQDSALERFNEGRRTDCKEWINYVLGQIWALEPWPFKDGVAAVTVTAGSTAVTNLPADIGVVRLLQNSSGGKLTYRDLDEFMLRHYGETGTVIPYDFAVAGTGPGCQVSVGPPSSETSALYQLVYERDPGFYPSTTLTGTPTLPTSTIAVASTVGAQSGGGQALVAGRLISYTGTSGGNQLTGCTGGVGTFAIGDPVVYLNPQGGPLYADTDVPTLPPDMHQILVHGAQAIGQTGENDYSLYLSDDRVQQGLNAMRLRYLVKQRGETMQWGSYDRAHFETGEAW